MPYVLPVACTVDGWHQHAPPRIAADIWCWPCRTVDPLLLVLCLAGAVGNLHTVLPCSMFTLPTPLVCICSTCRHCPIGVGPRMLMLPGFDLAVTGHAGPARWCGHAAKILPCCMFMLPMLPMCICCTVKRTHVLGCCRRLNAVCQPHTAVQGLLLTATCCPA